MLFRSLYRSATTYSAKNALVIGDTCVTYSQLLFHVEHIIARLRSLGVQELDCVALVLPNSLEFVASFYALSHLHAISLLIDPNVKPDELKFFFLDNEVKFVITEAYHSHLCREVIAATDLNIHCIELEDLTTQERVNTLTGREISLPDVYDGPVIYQYSSGSTGRSKRICRTQKNLVCEAETVIAALRMTARDNVLGLLPLFHSFGLNTCLLGLIAAGATLVLFEQTSADNSKRNVPLILQTSRILELIQRERITILPSAPYLYDALAETPEEIQYDLSSVRLCLAGGNFIPEETFQRFLKRFGIPIRSVYGSTELGYIAVNMERDTDVQYDCSGIPPAGVEVKILDDTMREVLPNNVGEIAVKSAALASGYLNMVELNAKVFRDGFFLVGDVGKKDEQGRLSVVGRKRIFIDAGGEKVDPQEIEQVLSAHPAVKEVAVIGVPGPYGAEAIKAVLVPKAALTEEEVWSFCKERLTEYKVPRFIVFRDALPRSPLGKLLRKHLVGDPTDPVRENTSSSRRDPLRQTLLAFHHDQASAQRMLTAWICQQEADLLRINVSQVDAQRSFSEAGLGSLLSVELRNNLEAALELTFPISILWSYSTPEDLSSHLTSLLFTQAKRLFADTSSSYQKKETKKARTEPIAVIGMSCRFPGGANSPEAFWQMLAEGHDAIRELPPDRYDINEFYSPDIDAPGKTVSRWGGFLDQIDQFDPTFFNISPREATYLDPQQRLLLEVTWEAMERAGLLPEKLAGSQTGVFIGLFNRDYFDLLQEQLFVDRAASANAYMGTGNGPSFAAGRLSYLLGLHGPSMVLDTVCSSSLVAIHLACQSLHNQECDVAFAGAVSLNFYPLATLITSKMRALSPHGRSKTFDASADGFVRGEGCGVIVLKRLSQAQADGDQILALIRGSAVNHDGRSNGLTAPNGQAQEAVIRQALSNAGVDPGQISYIEAHGTGTVLGDPIEFEALKAVIGQAYPNDSQCMLGSVKTNIGHLEASAGMAGLIKTILCMQHKAIPGHLHLETLNPHIKLEETPFVIPTQLSNWPARTGRRYAGVSAAGLSGTNAHVVLEEAPEPTTRAQEQVFLHQADTLYLLPISANDPEALRQLAETYRTQLLAPDGTLKDIPLLYSCYTASVRRTHYTHRLALVGASHEELALQLEAFLQGRQAPGMTHGIAGQMSQEPVFVFSGQGSQWIGMGRQLFLQEPVFRTAIEKCDACLRKYVSWSLLEELQADQMASRLNETQIAQPALFAMQVALTALWRSWGIEPGAVVGHSVGEIAAAYVAGVLELDDAVQIVAHRGALMQQAQGQGYMVAAEISETQAEELLTNYSDRVAIAAINSPSSVVLSGDTQALDEVLNAAKIQPKPFLFRRLNVDYAFHSPQMKKFQTVLVEKLQAIKARPGAIPVLSTVTGQQSSGEEYDATYWGQNMCQPVRFGPAIEQLSQMGYRLFLEVSPQPVLARSMKQCLTHHKQSGLVLPSLRQGLPERAVMLNSLSAIYVQGYPVNWRQVYSLRSGSYKVVPLPTYAWQRKRYWLTRQEPLRSRATISSGTQTGHPLLSLRVRSATRDVIFETIVSPETHPWLYEHQAYTMTIFPASGYVEMMQEAARNVLQLSVIQLTDFFIHQALLLPLAQQCIIQLLLQHSADENVVDIQILSCLATDNKENGVWTLHASTHCQVEQGEQENVLHEKTIIAEIQGQCNEVVGGQQHYQRMRDGGLIYGPLFQGMQQIWRRNGEALGQLQLPSALEEEQAHYFIHPVLLDACFQVVEACFSHLYAEGDEPELYLPLSIDSVRLSKRSGKVAWAHALVRTDDLKRETGVVDIDILNEAGELIVQCKGFHFRKAPRTALAIQSRMAVDHWLYEMQWEEKAHKPSSSEPLLHSQENHGSWLLFCDQKDVGQQLAKQLRTRGEQCLLVFSDQSYLAHGPEEYSINPSCPEHFHTLLQECAPSCKYPYRGVVYLWALDALSPTQFTIDRLEREQTRIYGSLLHLVQALAQAQWNPAPHLWLITQNCQRVTEEAPDGDLTVAHAPVWGLGRVIAQEQPDLDCKMIDLPHQISDYMDELLKELLDPDQEDQMAFRQHRRYVARLVVSKSDASYQQKQMQNLLPIQNGSQHTEGSFRSDSTYLITGGLGGLGMAIAEWMVENKGVRYLVLTGRSAPKPEISQIISHLERSGAQIGVIQADISKQEEVVALLQGIQDTMPPLRGIIHAAGILDDGVLIQQNWERFARVLAPKLQGSWNLHVLTRNMPLDFFLLFSSGASLMGAPGQSNYATANAFMDGLAHYRRFQGLPAISINWGAWASIGMTKDAATSIERRLEQDGMQPISLKQGTAVLEQLLLDRPIQIGVLPIDWSVFAHHLAADRKPPVLEKVLSEKVPRSQRVHTYTPTKGQEEFKRQLQATSKDQYRQLLQTYVYQQVRDVLGLDETFHLELKRNMFEVGLDSLMAVDLRNRLQRGTELTLPANLVFDHPTVDAIIQYIAAKLLHSSKEATGLGEGRREKGAEKLPKERIGQTETKLFDVAVVGGGPAGSTTAALLAKKGYRVLLVEKEKFPRYHIGESTVPGMMPILEELGISEEIERRGFVVKKGGTLVWGRDREPWSFSFTEAGPWVHAFQVVRSELDTILLNTARRYGAMVWEETQVTNFLFEQERGCGLKYVTNSSSQPETVSARFLVDASGQSALLARKKAFLEWDDDLKNVAIWAYYQGGKNLDGELAGNILIENLPDGWLWVIPLHDGTHSVGLVTPASRVSGRQALEEQLERMLANSVESKKLLASAQRVSQYRTARDWSYRSKSFAGPGFLLTGDAAGFVDPLFSTGVFLALRGAGLAADAIDGVLKEPEKESELLRRYEQSYLDFFDVVTSFVRYFYDASKDREAYWGRAQQLIDPFKHMNARQDFVHLISGLVGRDYLGGPDPSSLENGKPEPSEE